MFCFLFFYFEKCKWRTRAAPHWTPSGLQIPAWVSWGMSSSSQPQRFHIPLSEIFNIYLASQLFRSWIRRLLLCDWTLKNKIKACDCLYWLVFIEMGVKGKSFKYWTIPKEPQQSPISTQTWIFPNTSRLVMVLTLRSSDDHVPVRWIRHWWLIQLVQFAGKMYM